MSQPLDYRCPKCGSREVVCDASASWDRALQTWEISSTYDAMHCTECDHDTNSDAGWTVPLVAADGGQNGAPEEFGAAL